jgi:hypothetical protein
LLRAAGVAGVALALLGAFDWPVALFAALRLDGEYLVVRAEKAFLERYVFRLLGRLKDQVVVVRRRGVSERVVVGIAVPEDRSRWRLRGRGFFGAAVPMSRPRLQLCRQVRILWSTVSTFSYRNSATGVWGLRYPARISRTALKLSESSKTSWRSSVSQTGASFLLERNKTLIFFFDLCSVSYSTAWIDWVTGGYVQRLKELFPALRVVRVS